MEGFFVLESKNEGGIGNKPKVEKMAKDSTGSAGRKRLADISNLPRRPSTLTQDDKLRSSSATVKEYIEQLQKENTALVKLLADRKIIELSGAELQKLRVALQKMQQQNLQLAQSNSQMLAELNSGKDRLKALQHELGCKNGLLIAKKLELEGKAKMKICQTNDSKKEKMAEHEETGVSTVVDRENDKQCNPSRRQKSKSLGPSVKKVQDNDVADSKRLRSRRQSARFKSDEAKSTEDFFEMDTADLPPCPLPDDKMQEPDSNSMLLPVKKEDGKDEPLLDHPAQEHRRSSLSRPSRQAAKKVQSYKEPNLHVKMRRTE